jgi:hypothetical protein
MKLFDIFKKKKNIYELDYNIPVLEDSLLSVRIESTRYIVDATLNGHLSLCHRVDLLSEIHDVHTVNKIFFECVKKVYPIWHKAFPHNNIVMQMLLKANSFLYLNEGDKHSFSQMGMEHNDYLLDLYKNDDINMSMPGLVGLAAQSLMYSIAYDAGMILEIDEYAGEDDDVFDYEGWNPDFYASMAYSGGNPFANEGNISLRKKFWNWYLDTVEAFSSTTAPPPVISLDFD